MEKINKSKLIKSLISSNKLNELILNNSKNIKLFDCTYPSFKGKKLFEKIRIKNAKFLDFDLLKSNNYDSSNQTLGFPDKNQILNFLKENLIKKSDEIILYDQYGIYSSPRVWYLLNIFQIQNIKILDGGLPNWIKNNLPIDRENLNESSNEEENEEISKEHNLYESK